MIGSIISAIVIGLIVGLLGRLIVPGRQNISLLMTVIIGIIASLIGGVLLGLFAYNNNNGGIPWLSIIVGAILAAGGILIYGRTTSKA